jgi:hypothetical protein
VNGVTVVVIVIGGFFLIGIMCGVLTVIAASALRSDTRRADRKRAGGNRDGHAPGWEEPPKPDEVGADDGTPSWRGGPSAG